MNRHDSRNSRQGWTKNPLISSSDSAVAQALSIALDWVKLQRNTVTKFNDKGRPDHVTEWVDFQCVVTPDGEVSRTMTAGGDRKESHYTVMWLKPQELPLGSVLIHDTFGMMKIESYDPMTQLGLCSAKAVGLSAGTLIEDGKTLETEEQREIF